MHFPRLRMHQPFWPYSSASCRLSCFFAASAFLPAPFMFAVTQRSRAIARPGSGAPIAPAPYLRRNPCSQTQWEPLRSGIMPDLLVPFVAAPFAPSSNVRRACPSSSGRPRGLEPAQPKVAKAFARVPGAPGASFACLMILRSGAAPLQGTNNLRCLVRQSCRRSFLRLCPRPLWKAFRQDQVPRSITNFTQN